MPLDQKAKRMILGITALLVVLVVAAIVNHLLPDKERDRRERGERYYKSVGSWPNLSDGRSAIDVARERCARATTAF